MSGFFGEGHPLSKPAGVTVTAELDVAYGLVDLTASGLVDRMANFSIARAGVQGPVQVSIPLSIPTGSFYALPAYRRIFIEDRNVSLGTRYTRYGMFWTQANTSTTKAEREAVLNCIDNSVVFQRMGQIPGPGAWPNVDGSGLPVVNTTSSTTVTPGVTTSFTVADPSHLYGPNAFIGPSPGLAGKPIYIGADVQQERVQIASVSGNTVTLTAAIAQPKNVPWPVSGGLDDAQVLASGFYMHVYTSGDIPLSGSRTITTLVNPQSLGFSTTRPLWVMNADGTNGESVTPTAVTSTTFTATFASSHGTGAQIGILTYFPGLVDLCFNNARQTTVTGAIAAGTRTVTPTDMTNIYPHRILNVVDQSDPTGATYETVVVTATGPTNFTAVFQKAHAANWFVYNGLPMLTDGISNVVLSHTSLNFYAMTAEDAFKIVQNDNLDPAKNPQWRAAFNQDAPDHLSQPWAVRPLWYDALSSANLAPVALVEAASVDNVTQTQWETYSLETNGSSKVEAQAVYGANASYGTWPDAATIAALTHPVVWGKPIQDPTCLTNADCVARAHREVFPNSTDKKMWRVTTPAQISPDMFYGPLTVSIHATREPDSDPVAFVGDLVDCRVHFQRGFATYEYLVGDRPRRMGELVTPRVTPDMFTFATIARGSSGQVAGIGGPSSQVKTASFVADKTTFAYQADASAAPQVVTLPKAKGRRMTIFSIKKTDASANAVTLQPYGSETIEGAVNLQLTAQNQGVLVRSEPTTGSWVVMSGSAFPAANSNFLSIPFWMDSRTLSGGIAVGDEITIRMYFACTLQAVTLMAEQANTSTWNLLRSTLASYPTFTALNPSPISFSSGDHAEITNLTGWTTAIAAGDILRWSCVANPGGTLLTGGATFKAVRS